MKGSDADLSGEFHYRAEVGWADALARVGLLEQALHAYAKADNWFESNDAWAFDCGVHDPWAIARAALEGETSG